MESKVGNAAFLKLRQVIPVLAIHTEFECGLLHGMEWNGIKD